ncbi:16S rRNA (guanine(966)-N(2))-methyltransferase RsmD [Agathobaculum sp. NTUH-O15-33]|uniref:16S rRNA (guanine(966)-N(2))-methyltransferase RsmD n=1 Tax=Agathobaculum sp. NTUH-O15-33 TaxID=3079302 RepID=UPI00295833CF|nr:16S rRNA (guanine(966)-N(2))-methyltransferase RsmD [Agathobaculum sp. NTUH-O15-33]WNX83747.1 16S rRNA (guanine(966)-N(2))-methyltransferase RsmD [Agathobaculum sp. NTUH-O15-33]
MRVVSGSARGLKLQPVPGMNTRPTTDRVKESVFNIIQNRVRDARVLDLFAGTGQLGIEALSRGAKTCDFVERDRVAFATVKKNIAAARLVDRAQLHSTDADKFIAYAKKDAYDLIFLDPPYGGKILTAALSAIETFDILSTNGIIICESAVEDVFTSGFETVKTYRYGATLITVLQKGGRTDETNENCDLPGQL